MTSTRNDILKVNQGIIMDKLNEKLTLLAIKSIVDKLEARASSIDSKVSSFIYSTQEKSTNQDERRDY